MANIQEQDKIGLVGMSCGQTQRTTGQEESGTVAEQSEMVLSTLSTKAQRLGVDGTHEPIYAFSRPTWRR